MKTLALNKMSMLVKNKAHALIGGVLSASMLVLFSVDSAKRAWRGRQKEKDSERARKMMGDFDTPQGAQKRIQGMDVRGAQPGGESQKRQRPEADPEWKALGLAIAMSRQSAGVLESVATAWRGECSASALGARLEAIEYGMARLSDYHRWTRMGSAEPKYLRAVPGIYQLAGFGSCVEQADRVAEALAPVWLDSWATVWEHAAEERRPEMERLAEQWANTIEALPPENGAQRLAEALGRSTLQALSALSVVARAQRSGSSLAGSEGLIDALILSKQLAQEVAPVARGGQGAQRI